MSLYQGSEVLPNFQTPSAHESLIRHYDATRDTPFGVAAYPHGPLEWLTTMQATSANEFLASEAVDHGIVTYLDSSRIKIDTPIRPYMYEIIGRFDVNYTYTNRYLKS